MLTNTSEARMRQVRWVLAIGWLILIISLFYDPVSAQLTDPTNRFSPLRLDLSQCIQVQGACLPEQPYALGAPIFWGMVVPSAIFILLIFGHELWRRICPLSFLSQIPRALGWERKRKRQDKKTGKVRTEIVKVAKNSGLAKNHFYLQFGLFFVGLCCRILFVNSNRLALGLFLILTIIAAIIVGFLYGGKAWCQYFCPMAPVQTVYAEPRGLLARSAHEGDRQLITQSMCRTIKDGKELSACVACQSPCIDIDAERSYWNRLMEPTTQWNYYGYVGLAVGYFVYYFLYAGNWNYYLSGAWPHEENQLANIWNPGFYLFDQAIEIPKLIAVPLVLGLFTWIGIRVGRLLEKRYQTYQRRQHRPLPPEVIRHRMLSLSTFLIFNFFFIFAGQNYVQLLPPPVPDLFSAVLATLSTLWLYRTWDRNRQRYQRESFASRLRKQLKKLNLDIPRFLEGRSLDDLNVDEVYVLAKVIPDFSKDKKLQTYKGVLQESFSEGYVVPGKSLESFSNLRKELEISDQEHETILTEISQEYPELFDPNKQRDYETFLRLESYREALLKTILTAWKQHPDQTDISDLMQAFSHQSSAPALAEILQALSQSDLVDLKAMRQEYGISAEEELAALRLTDPDQLWHDVAESLGLMEYLKSEGEEGFKKIYAEIDADQSGEISYEELRDYLKKLDPHFSEAQIRTMFERADVSKDNVIVYSEFVELFKQLTAKV
jgi:Ca2+-binding EF-hand superfamily protein